MIQDTTVLICSNGHPTINYYLDNGELYSMAIVNNQSCYFFVTRNSLPVMSYKTEEKWNHFSLNYDWLAGSPSQIVQRMKNMLMFI